MELGPDLLERCHHLRGCYIQASMELGEMSSLQRLLCTGEVITCLTVSLSH